MGLNASSILQGVASSLLTDRVKHPVNNAVNEVLEIDTGKSSETILAEIHELLVLFYEYFNEQSIGKEDVFQFVQLYKFGIGPLFIPRHTSNRVHYQIFGPGLLLNVVAPGLGSFNITSKTYDWTNIDFPDGSSYALDTSVASTTVTYWLRETNAQIV